MLQLWFVSRALGAMALLLLSLVIVLGVLHNTSVVRNAELGLPRFVLVALHRNLSLITVVFIALHVVTVLVTDYVHLRVVDLFVPGIARFNPIAAALGTVATDVVIAVVVTSVLRSRISRRVWFWVHWTSYLCWPVTVAHAVLNVSFRGTTWWTLLVPLVSMVAIVWALLYRRSDQRRVAVPVAERGKVTEEAIRQVTGELPIARPAGPGEGAFAGPDPDAATELLGPVTRSGGGPATPAAEPSGTAGHRAEPGAGPRAPVPRPGLRSPADAPAAGPPGAAVPAGAAGPGGAAGSGGAGVPGYGVASPAERAPAPTGDTPGRHHAAGEDPVDAPTETLSPVERRTRRAVVPLAPRSSRR